MYIYINCDSNFDAKTHLQFINDFELYVCEAKIDKYNRNSHSLLGFSI